MKKTTALVLLAVLIVTSLFGMTACNTGHKHNLEHVTATPATCTENGNSEYWYCRDCNKYFADQSATKEIEENSWVIAATGHTFSDEWTFDDQYHWHKATCEHSDLTKDRQEHNLVDGECTICDYSVTKYTVTFVTNGGSAVSPMTTSVVNESPVTTQEGYKFLGWYTDNGTFKNKVEFPYAPKSDITLYAKWEEIIVEPTEFTVTFVTNGGSKVQPITSSVIETSPETTQEGYKFLGWYTDNGTFEDKVDFPYAPKSDITLYAKWKKIIVEPTEFTVTFVTNGGSEVQPITSSVIETSPETTQEGYNFLGWYTDDVTFKNKVEFPYYPKNDITLYANWEEQVSEIVFKVDSDGTLTEVTGLVGQDNVVVIPAQVNGITVKRIGTTAFKQNNNISEVVVPEGVTQLDYQCFNRCENLKKITLPESLKVIGSGAFEYCTSLESVNFPSNLQEIRNDAFTGTALTSVKITGPTDIWQFVFKDCTQLVEVDLGNAIGLSNGAFQDCTSLKSIVIPETIKSLRGEYNIFNGCTSLVDISLPDTGIQIPYSLFNNTGYYKDPSNWKDGVLYVDGYLVRTSKDFAASQYTVLPGTIAIADDAFTFNADGDFSKLTSVTLPEGLLRIGENAFEGCTVLSQINMPSTVKSVGYKAFSGTAFEKSSSNWQDNGLYLGNWLLDVKSVSMSTFTVREGTVGIASAYYLGSLFTGDATKVESIVLPDSLKYIGDAALANTNIKSIALPQGLKELGNYAFYQCYSLETVDIKQNSSLETIGESVFTLCKISTIYIPESVKSIGSLIFNANSTNLTVNCAASVKPQGWAEDWAKSNGQYPVTVNWGVKTVG